VRRCFIAFALGAIVVALTPGRAPAAPHLSPAAESLSSCVQANGRLSVLMLIDESGSLATTDPYNQRVDGIRAALTGLADLAETEVGGRRPEVSVLMAGFFGLVRPSGPEDVPDGAWMSVSHENIDHLLVEAGQYKALNHGKATDYATALTAARKLLAARVAEETVDGDAAPCQALIWFTDGRYSLPRRVGKAGVGLPLELPYAPGIRLDQPGVGERAVAAGKQFMCRPNGLMDGLQSDGVMRFTVALSTELSPADAAFLRAATTGASGRQRCGSHLSQLSGDYLPARDGDQLFFAFAGLTGSQPPVREVPVCPKLSCVRGMTSFDTVDGLSQFLIRASGGAEASASGTAQNLELQLRGPSGQSVTLDPGGPSQLSLDGTSITERWVSDRAVEVQGDFAPANHHWRGRWSYAFVDASASAAPSQKAFSSVQLFADLAPGVEGSPVLIRGSPTKLTFKLTTGSDPDQAVTSGPLLRSAHLIASVEDPVAGTSTRIPVAGPAPDGTFSAAVKIPSSSTVGFVYLGLTASFSTAAGTPIAPQYRSFDIPVRFPPGQGFPTVSPATLSLPSLRGDGDTEGGLTVKGSSVSAGCIWIGPPDIDAPSEAGRVGVTISPTAGTARHCLRVEKGEERHLEVRLSPSSEATGTVTASIPVHLSSDIVETDHVVSVPARFAMAPAPNDVVRNFLLAALVLLGTLLPLLLLHVLNVFGARFAAPNRLRALDLPVEMSHGGRLRRRGEDGPPVEVDRGEALFAHGSRPVRELKLKSVEFEAFASGSLADRAFELFRGPYGVARAAGRKLVVGSAQPLRSWRGGATHEVPLGLAGTWIFRFDGLRPAETGEGAAGVPIEGSRSAAGRDEDDFFAPRRDRGRAEGAQTPRAPRKATIEGRLILLTSDGPPVDQAEVLFGLAEQGLLGADELWEEEEPKSEEPGPGGDEGLVTEPEPAPPPPPSGETDWQTLPAPPERPRNKPKGGGARDDYF
jgi:hypothetical protein